MREAYLGPIHGTIAGALEYRENIVISRVKNETLDPGLCTGVRILLSCDGERRRWDRTHLEAIEDRHGCRPSHGRSLGRKRGLGPRLQATWPTEAIQTARIGSYQYGRYPDPGRERRWNAQGRVKEKGP